MFLLFRICSAGIVLVGEKDVLSVEWREVGNRKMLVRTEVRNEGKEKIAAFDIDGTLKILYSEVPGKLKKLVAGC